MCPKELLLLACLFLLGGLRLTSTTTTTTFVAAMSIANQDLDRYFRTNSTQMLAIEDRIMVDFYNYAFLNYSYQQDAEWKNVSFTEEKARYGEGKILDVEGKLVHISHIANKGDDSACSPQILGTLGMELPDADVTWIALVRRGGCTFEEKVKHVYEKGASGVIIYNDKPVYNLEKMQIKDKKRNIAAVITYLDIGQDMARILDSGISVQAAIRQGRGGSRPINTLNRTSVLFVSISFIVLMVISLVWLLFYYIQRFRYLQTKDQQSRQLCSVTKKAIMKIPTKTGKSSDEKDIDSDCCAICIEAYKPSDTIRVLPCNHEFHKNCIDPWLVEHRTCPMCKLDVLKFYGFVVGDQIHSTPSPQHAPPMQPTNTHRHPVALGEHDVEVIVVALAPPFSAAQQPPSSTSSSSANPTNPANYQSLTSTSTSAVASTSTSATTHAATHAQPEHHVQNLQNLQNSSCSCCSSLSNYCSCSAHTSDNSGGNRNDNSNVCNVANRIECCACNHGRRNCIRSRALLTAGIAGGAVTNGASGAAGASHMRRNSAPLVLQVSTASRQVTDV